MSLPDSPDWRSFERHWVDHPAFLLSGRARVPVQLVDVSMEGVRYRARISQDLGEEYGLELVRGEEAHAFRMIPRWDFFYDGHFLVGAEVLGEGRKRHSRWWDCVSDLVPLGRSRADVAIEKRLAKRVVRPRPILFLDRDRWVKGTLANTTEEGKGALLVVRTTYAPGTEVHFQVKVGSHAARFRAQAVRVTFVDGQYHVGVHFVEPEPHRP